MGGLFGNNNSAPAAAAATASNLGTNPGPGQKIIAGGYPDDGARPMPSFNDPVATENLRQLRLKLSSTSGRTATDLTGSKPYVNNFLGSTG